MNTHFTVNTPNIASQPHPPRKEFQASSVLAMAMNYEAKISNTIDRNRTVIPTLAQPILGLYDEETHGEKPYHFISKLAIANETRLKMQDSYEPTSKNQLKLNKSNSAHERNNSSQQSSLEKERHDDVLAIDYGREESIDVISSDDKDYHNSPASSDELFLNTNFIDRVQDSLDGHYSSMDAGGAGIDFLEGVTDYVSSANLKIRSMFKRMKLANETPAKFGYIQCLFSSKAVQELVNPPVQMYFSNQRRDIPLHNLTFCIEADPSQLSSFFNVWSKRNHYFTTGTKSSNELEASHAKIVNYKNPYEPPLYIVIKVCGTPSYKQVNDYIQRKICSSLAFPEAFTGLSILDEKLGGYLKNIVKDTFTSITTVGDLDNMLDNSSSKISEALNHVYDILSSDVNLKDAFVKADDSNTIEVLTTCKNSIKEFWDNIFHHKKVSDFFGLDICKYVSGPLDIERHVREYSGENKSSTRFRIELSRMESAPSKIALQFKSESPITFASLEDILVEMKIVKHRKES
ncbi:MAG: hypothetical protein KAG53_03710 [Endozoicomonadaceae bacterium]|nr:hypothetical protein [Endozoicomonadaceae bacterium]